MSEFKPYEQQESYTVVLTKDEALLIQRMRELNFGSITVHLVNGGMVRTETTDSELSKKRREDTVTIAVEIL